MNAALNTAVARPTTAFDLKLLAELHRAIFTAPWDQAWSEESLAQILAMPGVGGWIVESDSGPIGFALARFTLDEGEILLTGILPAARGRGHARRLIQAVIAAAQATGVARLFLEHAAPNEAAAALYRGLGFVPVGRRRDYYRDSAGKPYDAITMGLELLGSNAIDPSRVVDER